MHAPGTNQFSLRSGRGFATDGSRWVPRRANGIARSGAAPGRATDAPVVKSCAATPRTRCLPNIVAIGRPTETVDELANAIARKLDQRERDDEGFQGVTYTTTEVRKGMEAHIELRVEGIADDSIAG